MARYVDRGPTRKEISYMNDSRNFHLGVVLLALFLSTTLPAIAKTGNSAIASRTATVEGAKLHYLTAGHGPAVILLHGYTQTSRMWRPIIPLLAEKFTVIAPDLPGIGDSSIPGDNKIDMITAAQQI